MLNLSRDHSFFSSNDLLNHRVGLILSHALLLCQYLVHSRPITNCIAMSPNCGKRLDSKWYNAQDLSSRSFKHAINTSLILPDKPCKMFCPFGFSKSVPPAPRFQLPLIKVTDSLQIARNVAIVRIFDSTDQFIGMLCGLFCSHFCRQANPVFREVILIFFDDLLHTTVIFAVSRCSMRLRSCNRFFI